jgi:prepilin-type N-terminal cleavage/methylation domain-containing protein
MKTNLTMRRGFTLVELLVVIAIIATLAGVGVPAIIAQKKKGDRSEATMNAKQIGLALFGFDEDYGSYPSPATAEEVKENNPDTTMTLGNSSSNDYFRQLLAAGHMDQEKPFYAKAPYTKKPDNDMSGSEALDNGEVGFAYIMASQTEALSSSGNSARPIIAAAVYNGLSDGTFDLDVYDKKAVILRLDNSASVESIRPSDKRVLVGGGRHLLQTGEDTVWGEDITPVIVAPLKASGN